MVQIDAKLGTGLTGLDEVLKGLIPGDNLVWQVSSVDDYRTFASPYGRYAISHGQRLIYFRFASHPPLIDDDAAEVHHLDPTAGFEQFITSIHQVIREVGRGGYYLFDCLSELTTEWHSDQMLANFFRLTCPRLYDVAAIAYFALLRNHHSFHAIAPIAETTQVLLDVLRHKGTLYLQPMKVQQRYSPTMYMLHARRGEQFVPVTQSAMISEIRHSAPWQGLESASAELNVWNRSFFRAQEALAAVKRGEAAPEVIEEHFDRLLRMVIARSGRVAKLAKKYLTLSGVLDIGRRMLGTGLIGGKSVGMLLARAILEQTDRRWSERLEPHDSFYIGSDVFYTFLVRNGAWWPHRRRRDLESMLEGCAPPACWKTTTATPSRASTRASFASTRARGPNAWRTSSRPCERSTPAP